MEITLRRKISETRKFELLDGTNHRARHFFFRLSQFLSTVIYLLFFADVILEEPFEQIQSITSIPWIRMFFFFVFSEMF